MIYGSMLSSYIAGIEYATYSTVVVVVLGIVRVVSALHLELHHVYKKN